MGTRDDRRAERLLQYPAYDVPLLAWYDGIYDSVFVAYHPFLRLDVGVPQRLAGHYPSDAVIRRQGRKVPWAEVASGAGLADAAAVNNALLSRIMAISLDHQTPAAAGRLVTSLEANRVWPPDEGFFSPLMEADILAALDLAGEDELVAVDEFGGTEVRQPRRELGAPGTGLDPVLSPIHARGSLFPPSQRFLFTGRLGQLLHPDLRLPGVRGRPRRRAAPRRVLL